MKMLKKRIISVSLSICLVLLMSSSVFASVVPQPAASDVQQQFDVTTVTLNGNEIEVPVLRKTVQTYSANPTVTHEEFLYIPDMSKDSLENNKSVVQEIKTYGAPVSTYGYGDFHVPGYIWFHSTLNYSTITKNGYSYYDLSSFMLEREIYSESPFASFHKADTKALQVGDTFGSLTPGEEQAQEKYFGEIEYGTTYYVPSYWEPATPVGYDIGVFYSVYIDYGNGQEDYYLDYTHKAV